MPEPATIDEAAPVIRYSIGKNRFDAHPVQREAESFDDFEHTVLSTRAAIKGLFYVAAAFNNDHQGKPHRGRDHAQPTSFLCFDFDGIPSQEAFADLCMFLGSYRGFGYTTASHTPEAPRARAILLADREMGRDERMRVSAYLEQCIAMKVPGIKFDASVYRPEQPCFTPVFDSQTFTWDGSPVDVDSLLAFAPKLKEQGPSTAENLIKIETTDPVLNTLRDKGMIKRELGGGRFGVVCPCSDSHSGPSESDTATVYTLPKFNGFDMGNFTCLHDHCSGRPQKQFMAALGLDHAETRLEQTKLEKVDFSELINKKTGEIMQEQVRVETEQRVLVIKPFDFQSTIPPRQLITIGGMKSYAKGFLSVTGAAGGTGKSSLAIVEELSLALGVDLFHPEREPLKCGRQRVWSMSLEDDELEHRRRVMAAIYHYRIDPAKLIGWYFVTYKNDSPINVAIFDKMGGFLVSPQVEEIERTIKEREIDVINVDPFVNTHSCPENDNVTMNKVADIWRSLAQRNNVALTLTHHIRKVGAGGEVTADDLRGAVSLISAARLVRVLAPMTQTEAASYGIEPGRARFYFWVNPTAKANIVPPAEKRSWFHMASWHLDNATNEWDEDVLGVVEAWEPPSSMDGVTAEDVVALAAKLRYADPMFLLSRCRESAQSTAWIGNLIGEILDIDTTDPQGKVKVKSIIKAWVESNVLRVQDVRSEVERKNRKCFVLGPAAKMSVEL